VNVIKLLKSEIIHQYKSFLYIVFTLVISLVGITLVESFKDSFSTHLAGKAKDILGSDLKISGRKKLTPDINEKIKNFFIAAKSLSTINTFSMGRANDSSRLVLVNQQREGFPFYGSIVLKSGKKIKELMLEDDEVVVYPEVLDQFNVKIGDLFFIGSSDFKIIDIVEEDSGQVFEMGAVAPKVFLSLSGMERAKLFQKGSTAFYSKHFKLETSISVEMKNKLNDLIDDNTYRVSLPKDSSDQVGRVTDYLTDFLGLVSLSSFILSLVGVFYLFRSYISRERKIFGILKALGVTSKEIVFSQIILMTLFSILSVLISYLTCLIMSNVLSPLVSIALGFDFELRITLFNAFVSFVISAFGVVCICYPLLRNELNNSASVLLMPEVKSKIRFTSYLPLLIGLFFLCVFFSHSFVIGGAFFCIILVTSMFVFFGGSKILKVLESKINIKNVYRLMTARYLTRYRLKTLSIFLSLFLSSFLITFIPGLRSSITSELDLDKKDKPNNFLFDIQEGQDHKIREFLKKREINLLGDSPMIRGRLLKINGKKVKSKDKESFSREGQRQERFRNRGVNLSYRKKLSVAEVIKSGDAMPGLWNGKGIPPVSLEYRYAKRIGAAIGDVLTFDILGIEQNAKVINLRKVRWSSFLPNFFIIFPSGVINDAPKTFLFAISSFQKNLTLEISKEFPNVSMVDLNRVIEKVTSVLKQMAIALASMSLLVLIVGIFVLVNLISQHLSQRTNDLFLYRLIGVENKDIKMMIKNEFVFLSFVASFFGALIGSISSGVFGVLFFHSDLVINFFNVFIVTGIITSICYLITIWMIRKFFKRNEILVSAF
jgi:putative ABC transport system permease protein